ncbi:MAG: PAS domain S-box protein [bacterium]
MEHEEKNTARLKAELTALRRTVSSLRKENARLKRDLECSGARILKAVCAVSEQFLRSAPQDDKVMQDMVAPLGEVTMMSRISIYENTVGVDGDLLTSKQYEWAAPDIIPSHDVRRLQVYSWKDTSLRRWRDLLSQGGIIYGPVKDLPAEERDALGLQDTVSIAVLPIFSGRRWWGFIRFEQTRRKREWSPTEVDALKTAADILGVLIYWKQMMDQRKESERRFRNLSEEISDGVVVIVDKRIRWVNKAFQDIFGYSHQELIGKGLDFLVVSEEIDDMITMIERELHRRNHTAYTEITAERADGVRISIDCVGRKTVFENEPGIQLLVRDVTKRKQVERALRDSEERFRVIVQNAPFPISIFDSTGIYLYTNRKFNEVFGYTLQDIPTGKRWFELAFPDPESRKAIVSAWKADLRELRKGRLRQRLFPVQCKDGKTRQIIFRPLPMSDDKLFVIYEDITDRMLAQEEIFKAKEYLEKVFNSVTDAIIVTTLKRRIVTCNNAAERVFGFHTEEIVGRSIRTLFPNKAVFKDLIRSTARMIREQGYFEKEVTLMRKDGNLFPASLISSLLIGADGKPTGIVAVGRDITERKFAEEAKAKLEAELCQARKLEAIGTLAGGIAHDFNNILLVILGYIELTMDALGMGSPALSNMEEAMRACTRGKELVRQILTFSRKVKQERKPVQIYPIVAEALTFMRASLPKTLEIVHHINKSCGAVMADPTQIHQIVINLCSNAFHAMKGHRGTLTVTLDEIDITPEPMRTCPDLKEGRYVRLTVNDTGSGIEAENLERIFDPFFTTKSPGEGTGMGLSTVLGIVKAHDGVITVSSQLGKGTTFTVYFPCLGTRAKLCELKQEPVPLGKERVLFVDDEEPITIVGKKTLERLGYRVTALTSSVEALEVFHEKPNDFDVVVTDQTLPTMTGMEFASKLKHIRPTIPIILTSGYSEVITEETAKAAGIRDFIMKPFLARDLATAIRRVMDQDYIV